MAIGEIGEEGLEEKEGQEGEMKILFLSPVQPLLTLGEPLPRWQMQASWVRALGRQGHEVRVVKYTPDGRIRLGWGERAVWNLRVIKEVRRIRRNRGIRRTGADLIIYSLGADVLFPQTIQYIKSKLMAPLVILSGVSPILDGNRRERAMAPLVDLAATNDEGHAAEWLRLGAKMAMVLPISAVDPELHYLYSRSGCGRSSGVPSRATPSRDIDVLFVGTLTFERRQFFSRLRKLLPGTVKMIVKEFVWEEEYARLMSRAKIGINLLRPEMKHGVNLRTFEIPALGAMEITSFCRDEWLAPGKEVEVFGSVQEAAELVKKYLRDDKAREKMAAAGRERVMKEHTFDDRTKRLMEMINDDPRRHFFDALGSGSSLTSSSPPRKSEREVLSGSSSMVSKMPSSAHHSIGIEVSVCIVNYKTDKELRRCLDSIKKFTKGVSYETIVIDNSTDNRWYCGGNNLAASRAKGRYLFFVNPDVYVENDAISDLVGWMDKHPLAAAAEPLQLSDRGDILPTGSKLNSPWLDSVELTFLSRLLGSVWRRGKILTLDSISRFRQSNLDRSKNWRTEVISGAAMMVRKEVFRLVGGFWEELKLYYTDTDLCRRMILAGGEVWHLGKIHVVHSLSASTKKLNPRFKNQIFAGDARKYYRLTGRPVAGELVYLSMLINGRLFLK